MKTSVYKILFFAFIILTSSISCRKFIEIDPPIQSVDQKDVFSNNSTAASALAGIYLDMNASVMSGSNSISVFSAFSADELISNDDLNPFYKNNVTENGPAWGSLYSHIFGVNSIIEGAQKSYGISENVKRELIFQSKFLRAFYYFYLVNLYGGVPLVSSTDFKTNSRLPRATEEQVYDFIINDLLEAQNNLGDKYVASNLTSLSNERYYANKYAATALLARVYLYKEKWVEAESASTSIIENPLYKLTALDDVFRKNSLEAILQIDNVGGKNTEEGGFFLPLGSGMVPNAFCGKSLLDNFQNDDRRKYKWIDTNIIIDPIMNDTLGIYYFPFKYKRSVFEIGGEQEYLMILRLAEQYLIRAEARVKLGDLDGARADLNKIRNRAGLANTVTNTRDLLIKEVLAERRVELFSEWGHRWFDLKRTKTIDAVMNEAHKTKGGVWLSYKSLYPIPLKEFKTNSSLLGHQNPGYREM